MGTNVKYFVYPLYAILFVVSLVIIPLVELA
jgi:hypothetical protein